MVILSNISKGISYYRMISNSLNSTSQQAELYESQNALLYDFDDNPSCKTVLLNYDTEIKVIAWIDTDIITGGKSFKIRCKPNQELKIGDVLTIDEEVWFVTKVDYDKTISCSGTLAKATCILKFFKNGIYRELPCYITVGTRNYINERDDDFIRFPKSLYTAYCPDIGYLDKKDVNMRFVIRGYVYRAVGVDNLTVLDNEIRDGLIIMKLQDDAIMEDDNLELEIANYWSQKPDDDDMATFSRRRVEVPTASYKISIDYKEDYFVCGEKKKITSIVQNRNGNSISTDRLIYVSDEYGNSIDYVQVVQQDNVSITLKITTDGKYIGKKIKLRVVCPQLGNLTFEKIFTINSIV